MMTALAAQLADTQRAFDSVADEYDGPLGNNPLVQRLRAWTLGSVMSSVASGSRLLDLGCGTGLDATHLARHGYQVTAIDWAPGMVRRSRERVAAERLDRSVTVHHLGIHELDKLPPATFDAAYSNLGSLNCVPDLEAAALSIASRLPVDGILIASVLGRFSPWEIVLFGLKGRWSRARVRWSADTVPVPLNGFRVWTRYYTPFEFSSVFKAAGFQVSSLRALGLMTPPPYQLAFAERHRPVVDVLQAVEDRVARWPGLRQWGDHFLISLRRGR
jgi:SAM-dependent methyltransferase